MKHEPELKITYGCKTQGRIQTLLNILKDVILLDYLS